MGTAERTVGRHIDTIKTVRSAPDRRLAVAAGFRPAGSIDRQETMAELHQR